MLEWAKQTWSYPILLALSAKPNQHPNWNTTPPLCNTCWHPDGIQNLVPCPQVLLAGAIKRKYIMVKGRQRQGPQEPPPQQSPLLCRLCINPVSGQTSQKAKPSGAQHTLSRAAGVSPLDCLALLLCFFFNPATQGTVQTWCAYPCNSWCLKDKRLITPSAEVVNPLTSWSSMCRSLGGWGWTGDHHLHGKLLLQWQAAWFLWGLWEYKGNKQTNPRMTV